MDYKIIEYYHIKILELEVVKYLNQGWRVSGGVSVVIEDGGITKYIQTLVKG